MVPPPPRNRNPDVECRRDCRTAGDGPDSLEAVAGESTGSGCGAQPAALSVSACCPRRFYLFFRVLWVVTVFIGSGLLFIAQPMIARMLLPRLGGAPAVWTTSVLFFQAVLLAGYGYAHWLGRRPRGKAVAIHAVLLLLPLGLLPFRLIDGAPVAAPLAPELWLLEALVLAVGAPLFVLSAGAPLLQKWLSLTRAPAARDPYFLYAAGNAGSLLALCAYPLLVEPAVGLERQGSLWAWGYGAYTVLALACAARAWRARSESADAARDSPEAGDASTPSTSRRWLWMALAAAPASLMLGVTSILTADMAAMPFVWVLTLGLYLLTFVLAFSPRPLLPPGLPARLIPIAAVVFMLVLMTKATEPLAVVLPAYLAAFFVAALACHTELFRLRPHPSHLTIYYALIGLGGALGGAFNALAAPVLFEGWTEAPLAFVAACLLVPRARPGSGKKGKQPGETAIQRSDFAIPIALGLSTLLLAKLGDFLGLSGQTRDVLAAGLPVLLTYLGSERRLRFGLAVGAVLWAGSLDTALRGRAQITDRSFYGIHRVTLTTSWEDGKPVAFHQLYHGSTIHGAQRVEAAGAMPIEPREPLAYYATASPIGRLLRPPTAAGPTGAPAFPERVGLVGLGAGSLLAYAEPGQRWSVFEIDPLVQRIAEDGRHFSYVPEARRRGADIEVVLGDARLTLSSARGSFDLLVLDAFTSGTIPVHLLTREAFDLYEEKLAPDGVLAFHISNRHLDLAPLVRAMAKDVGLAAVIVDGPPADAASQELASRWAFLARSSEALRARGFPSEGAPASESLGRVWTDDHSDVWSLFLW